MEMPLSSANSFVSNEAVWHGTSYCAHVFFTKTSSSSESDPRSLKLQCATPIAMPASLNRWNMTMESKPPLTAKRILSVVLHNEELLIWFNSCSTTIKFTIYDERFADAFNYSESFGADPHGHRRNHGKCSK